MMLMFTNPRMGMALVFGDVAGISGGGVLSVVRQLFLQARCCSICLIVHRGPRRYCCCLRNDNLAALTGGSSRKSQHFLGAQEAYFRQESKLLRSFSVAAWGIEGFLTWQNAHEGGSARQRHCMDWRSWSLMFGSRLIAHLFSLP